MRLPSFSKFFKQKIITGIDIQPEGIHLVQLMHEKQGYQLRKMGALPLEMGHLSDVDGMDWDKLTTLLFDWIRELGLVGAVTAAALPAHCVKLLRVDQPVKNESWLRVYLEQQLPGLGETVAVDYCPLSSVEQATLVTVAKRDYLDNYVACLREAGLEVKIMDGELFAIQRAFGWPVIPAKAGIPLLWQQRGKFTLIWHDEKQLPQQLRWPATFGEQTVVTLTQQLAQLNIKQLLFCGSTYYCDLFKRTSSLSDVINYFSPAFNSSGINMPDYLLAIGLAMREVPLW